MRSCNLRLNLVGNLAWLVALSLWSATALGCPFCAKLGSTFADSVAEADVAVLGDLSEARLTDGQSGRTRLDVLLVYKGDPALARGGPIWLPKFLAAAQEKPARRIVFADRLEDTLDPYRLQTVEPAMADYFAAAVRHSTLPPADRLGFFFGRLRDPHSDIALDAYKEFAKSPFVDVRAAASRFDPTKLRAWLVEPTTPAYQLGLIALLLGLTGSPADTPLLDRCLTSGEPRYDDGLDGLLACLALLEPSAGVEHVSRELTNAGSPFARRYAALRAARFLLVDAPPHPTHAKLRMALRAALAVPELADLVIDDLRAQRDWSAVDDIWKHRWRDRGTERQATRESVVRFLMECPTPIAKTHLSEVAASEPALLESARQNLQFERDVAKELSGAKPKRSR